MPNPVKKKHPGGFGSKIATPEQQIEDHILIREWFDNLPYGQATRTRKALQEFCGVCYSTVAHWLDGTRPIRTGYKRMINLFTNQQIFPL